MDQDYNPPATLPPEWAPEKIQQEYEEIDLMDYVKILELWN